VSYWKVILATLVIFCSGLVVGALLVKKSARTGLNSRPLHNVSTNTPISLWHQQQREFLRRMDHELGLNPEQRVKIEKILKDSQERTKQIREKIAPEMREELKNVREQIRTELTPEQQEKFEEVVKIKPRKAEDGKREGARRNRTNAPATNILAPTNP
jgi:Spy/CpxP family protein refolding chaperone